jgi:hypothetical protein
VCYGYAIKAFISNMYDDNILVGGGGCFSARVCTIEWLWQVGAMHATAANAPGLHTFPWVGWLKCSELTGFLGWWVGVSVSSLIDP